MPWGTVPWPHGAPRVAFADRQIRTIMQIHMDGSGDGTLPFDEATLHAAGGELRSRRRLLEG